MSDDTVETPAAAAARFLHSLFKPSHILVALSGGGDSVGLLVALAEAIRAGGHAHGLSAATVDHGLRPESADEVRDVAALCGRFGIPHQSRRWDGEKPKTGLMAAAREARYELLAEMAEAAGADIIVTAHTLDDQQETLAMRGARMAADTLGFAKGIADAVLFDRRIWVVRPFLSCGREGIREFLIERGVRWIDDPSNEDMHYERVRVRAVLRDSDAAELLGIDSRAAMDLSRQAAEWLDSHVRIHAGLLCEIARGALVANPRVIFYGLSHLTAVMGGQPFGPNRDTLVRIIDFLAKGELGRRTAGGVVFDLRRNALYLMRESRNITPLRLTPGARGIWDGRFDVVNRGSAVVRIAAEAAPASFSLPASVPNGVAQRVRMAAPDICLDADCGHVDNDNVSIASRLAPFDRFLTRFDYTFADRLALSFARTPYLSPPF